MIIIFADNDIDTELGEIADKYDRAKNANERERVAEEAYSLIGGRIKSMIGNASRGWRLGTDETDSLAWEGLLAALDNAGVSKIKRGDGVWETFIQRCRNGHPVGKRIWEMLSPDLRKTLESAFYLKATIAEQLVKELNAVLRRRDLYDPATWAGVSLSGEAKQLLDRGIGNLSNTELTRLNALLVSAACPEITVSPQPPPRSLLGYISKFWLPSMKSRIAEMAGAEPMSEYMVEARNALRPVIEELTQMAAAGILPPELARLGLAQRIYLRQKERLQSRYGPVIQWYNDQIKKLQPRNPFVVDSPASLRDARQLLSANNVPKRLWSEKSSPNYLPVSALEPIGVGTIQRVLDLSAPKTQDRRPSSQKPAQPSSSSGDVRTMNLLQGGHQSPAYRYLIERLFDADQTEHTVGLFLADNPSPSRSQVEQFQSSLPEDVIEDVDSAGWGQLVYQIDRAVLDAIREPQVQNEVLRALDLEPAAIQAMTDAICRVIFCRTTAFILKRAG